MILILALKNLFANKLRTFLSMLGIVIGVSSVISMLAIGAGAQNQIMSSINALGTDLLIVRSGQGGLRGVSYGTQDNLTIDDAKHLLKFVNGIYRITPVASGNVQMKYFNKNVRTNITGSAVTYFYIRNFEVERGRIFTESEVNSRAKVTVLGPLTAFNLFGREDPLEKNIKIKGINFKVVGILKSKGDQGWFNPDDQAFIPYTVAMKQVLGIDHLREIDLQVNEEADLNIVIQDVTKELRKTHRLQDDTPDDFNIRSQAEFLETASSFSKVFTILLGSIASISLLVGGIGIMNIMLVTVTERTREIGIRKAIGAREKDILLQFLLEALILSGIGGIIGIVLGLIAAIIIGKTTDFPTIIQFPSIVLAFAFAVSVGVFFGYYPAKRAASLDPIEALRHE